MMTSPLTDLILVTQSDLLDRSDRRLGHSGDRDPDDVTEPVLPLPGDEEAGADVLDESLQAEAERGADERGGRHESGQRHAEAQHDKHGGDDVDDGEDGPGDNLGHDMTVLGCLGADYFLGFGEPCVDALHDPAARPDGQPGEQDRSQCQEDDD
jgi:hypothetical protein